jgi:hypothetical protein
LVLGNTWSHYSKAVSFTKLFVIKYFSWSSLIIIKIYHRIVILFQKRQLSLQIIIILLSNMKLLASLLNYWKIPGYYWYVTLYRNDLIIYMVGICVLKDRSPLRMQEWMIKADEKGNSRLRQYSCPLKLSKNSKIAQNTMRIGGLLFFCNIIPLSI